MVSTTEKVLMQTAITIIENPVTHENKVARVMLDSGTQRSYMTTKLMEDLTLTSTRVEALSVRSFACKKPK